MKKSWYAHLGIAISICSLWSYPAFAAETIRFLHNETDPPSIEYYNKAIADFEKQNPDIQVEMEAAGTDARLQKLTAAVRAHTMPDVIKILPEERDQLATNGYLEPIDDIVDSIGRSDFLDGLLVPVNGKVYDVPYTLGNFSVLWYRNDLLKQAGLAAPTNWDETLAAAQKLTKDGIFGYAFPGGQNRQTSQVFAALMWSAGGTFFDSDFNVTFNNPGTIKALEYMKKIAAFSPPGYASYSAGDMVNVFLSGKVAMEVYAARVPGNVAVNNRDLLPKMGAAAAPKGPAGVAAEFVSGNSYAIASAKGGAKHIEAAKKFLKFLMSKDQLTAFSLTAFPHFIPPLKSVQPGLIAAGSDSMGGHDEFAKLSFDISNGMDFNNEAGAKIVDGKIVRSGKINPYAGAVVARGIPALVLQRVLVNNESPESAAAWGAQQMEAVVRELKAKN
ncbi:sugar ABC transporter substrate-binding protein [Rhizobium mayense]|uniref:Sugar ABC transporter substrate-binding protein n=2 Tax=Rhizobium mayense TaxID=1312184 RepID=A0ABT7JVJ6_9HYPH|nr:sugar ABC transporter substrate-binding protein [Rhizobium mayense]MDL2398944.1 sugar ABC transporter substrate-binding protein [Rhizobium mayense]